MTKRAQNKARPRTPAKNRSPATSARKSDAAKRPGGKLGLILDRLGRKTGATIGELVDATGWQKHSVHGALSRLRSGGFAVCLESTVRIPMKAATDSDGKAATHSDPKRPLFQRSELAGVIVAVG